MKDYLKNNQCRICKEEELEIVLDLGKQPPANALINDTEVNEQVFPLRLFWCKNCYLVQLLDIVNKKHLFSDYVYMTSASQPIVEHFKKYANDIFEKYFKNQKEFSVLEIGSNDGSLLKEFQKLGGKTIGIEPAKNLAKISNDAGIKTINEFFSKELATNIALKEKISLVVANNVIGHIDDLHELMEGIKIVIKEKGIFVFEVPYLVDLIKKLEFDTIYHEHLSYFSILPLIKWTEEHDLEIFDVIKQDVHGGSLRIFVSKKGIFQKNNSVKKLVQNEYDLGLDKITIYRQFSKDVEELKTKLKNILNQLKKQNKIIFGYGAPAKGNVLLNYCEINTRYLDYIIDTTPLKQGKFTPGTHIPILHPNKITAGGNKHVGLLLAWNYENEILSKEKEFRDRGGKFLIPLPTPTIK